ncbi:hypothetical protein OIU79_018360 [Salix purpurea]|uniref:Uncharacterized protein n=1 Tax=Salix purpurea TaxID=77065 RepID=A0A9Q0WZ62_SALPP|nr:hypothetical protein OIU79_018360 [Salix purpurea]
MGTQFDPALSTVDGLASLKKNLESDEATMEYKCQTLQKIQALTEESQSGNSCLLQLGFLPLLLELLFGKAESKLSQECVKFAEQALSWVLRLLSLGEYEYLDMLKEESKLESFQVLSRSRNWQDQEEFVPNNRGNIIIHGDKRTLCKAWRKPQTPERADSSSLSTIELLLELENAKAALINNPNEPVQWKDQNKSKNVTQAAEVQVG